MTPDEVADRLHMVLSDLGMPAHGRMKQVMEQLEWTESQAGKTLRGEQYPTVEMMQDLCAKYAVNLNWLLCGQGPMTRKEDMENAEAEALIWESVNQILVDENVNLGNAKRVTVYHFARRIYDRTQNVDIEAIRDFILSTCK